MRSVRLGEVPLEYARVGSGPSLLVLHDEGGPIDASFLGLLSHHADVIAPVHPGFERTARPSWFDGVDDIAYLYNDLIETLELHDVTLLGFSMGGWIAAEMAVRSTQRLAGLVLVDALGIKVSDRETRDIQDIFAISAETHRRLSYHDPSNAPDLRTLSETELELFARNREAAALYLWEPYAHNPKLLRRLKQLRLPSLVLWGESDGIVSCAYGRAFADAMEGAEFRVLSEAGHLPHTERPDAVAEAVRRFVDGRVPAAR